MTMTTLSTPGQQDRMAEYHLENLDEREREKLEATAADAERLAGSIRNYLKMLDFCTENGIAVTGKPDLSNLRLPGQLADTHEGDMAKLMATFSREQTAIITGMPKDLLPELEERMEK